MMKTNNTLLSIIIPTWNRAKTIRETIQSVQLQSIHQWELIIVDDGSDDGTQQIVTSLEESDPRIHFFNRNSDQKGGNVCRNEGLLNASGEFILFLDSDDILLNNCFANRINHLDANPNLDFIVFPGATFSKDSLKPEFYWNIEKKQNNIDRFLSFDSPWQTSGAIWRKSFLEETTLKWDENLQIWQDVDFHLNALLLEPQYRVLWNEPYDYLVRSSSADSLSRVNYYSESKRESRFYFWEKYKSLANENLIKAEWLRPLSFMVYKDSVLNRNWKRAKYIIDEGLQMKILDKGMSNYLNINSFLNRITRNRAGFAGLKKYSVCEDKTLQRVPIVQSS